METIKLIPPLLLLISGTIILIGSKRARVKSAESMGKAIILVSILLFIYSLTH